MYDIRQLCLYFPSIHSRYYIDTNGIVYSSLSPNTKRISINGENYNLTNWKNENLKKLDKWNNMLIRFKDTNYFLLYDGTILKRLKTIISERDEVSVSIITVDRNNKTGCYFSVPRLVAKTFIGDIEGKEIHHIDRNRRNNKVENLEILTSEEHRGKGKFKLNHK